MENKDLPPPLPEEDGAAKEVVKRGYKPLDHPFRIAWIQIDPIVESANEDKDGGFKKGIEILDKTSVTM